MALKRIFSLLIFSALAFAQSAGVTEVSLGFSSTPTFTANAGVTNFSMTLTGNVTSSTFSSAAVGSGSFRLCQDATGSRTFVFPSGSVGFGTIDVTPSKCSSQPWKWDGGTLRATGAMTYDQFPSVPLNTNAPGFLVLTGGIVSPTGYLGGVFNHVTSCPFTIGSGDEFTPIQLDTSFACAVTLPAATTGGFTAGAIFFLNNVNTGTATITSSSSMRTNLGGGLVTSFPLVGGQSAMVWSSGSVYNVMITTASATSGVASVNGLSGAVTLAGIDTSGNVVKLVEPWTVGTGGVTANTVVITDASNPAKIVAGTGSGAYGIALSTVSAAGTVLVARAGQALCVADNTVTAGDLIIPGTGTAIDCRDSGQTSSANISLATRIIGVALTSASAASTFTVALTPAHFGTGIPANSVGSTQMAVVNTRRTICLTAGTKNASSALADADLADSDVFFVPHAATVVEVEVHADAGTPNIILGRDRAGTVVNLTSAALATASAGAIACSNTGGTTGLDATTTCSATLQNTGLNAGDWLKMVSGTAGGTAKQMAACVTYTIN